MSEASGGRAAKGANSERRGGAPDDAVPVAPAKRSLHAADAFVLQTGKDGVSIDKSGW